MDYDDEGVDVASKVIGKTLRQRNKTFLVHVICRLLGYVGQWSRLSQWSGGSVLLFWFG